jgi:hypothetical protein
VRLAGVAREALLSGRTGAAFAGLLREALDAQTGHVQFAGLLREALLSTTAVTTNHLRPYLLINV